jgi:AcrR family transcriptional regulator
MTEAAEKLVAENGLSALTVQAVQREAGQRNKSAVSYHFGGLQGLVNALVARRVGPANARRSEMLLAFGDEASAADLVEVLVVPLVESVLARRPSYWARFLLQAISDPGTGLAALDAVEDRTLHVAQQRLIDRLDHLPAAVRALRVHSMFGYAAVVLAAYEVGVVPGGVTGEALTSEIVDACCGLVGLPARTIAETRRGS